MNQTKLVLHFSDFSTIFYAIYKKQPKHFYYLSYPFAGRPSERSLALQCGPWAAGQRRSGQTAGPGRPGTGGGGALGPRGPIPVLGCSGERADGVWRRRQRLPTTATPVPARLRPGQGKGWLRKLLQMRGKVENNPFWCAAGRSS
jgi:hypothetical protein